MSNIVIDITRNKKQEQFFIEVMKAVAGKSSNRFFGYGGGVRGGKTYVCLFILYLLCRKYPNSRWAVVRRNQPLLEKTSIPSMKKLAPPGTMGAKYKLQSGNMRVEFANGSQIMFVPENINNDPELLSFLGLEVNGFLLEQVEELDELTWERAKERTGSWYLPEMPPAFVFMSTNPTAHDHWFRKDFYDPYKLGVLNPPYFFLEALPTDNPFVTSDQWMAWEQMDPVAYKRMIEGDWDAKRSGHEFYFNFSRSRHVGDVAFNPDLPVHLSFDQNVAPYITLTCWQVEYRDDGLAVLQQFDEICLEGPDNTTAALCKEFLKKYPKTKQAYLYGDASGNKRDTRDKRTDYDIAKKELQRVVSSRSDRTFRQNPSVTARRDFINTVFDEKLPIRIFVGENCSYSIADLHNVKVDANGKKLKQNSRKDGVVFEKYGHTSDTMDYIICKVFEREFADFKASSFGLISNI